MHDRAAEPIGAATSVTAATAEIRILLSIEIGIAQVRLSVEEKRSALPSVSKRRPSPDFSDEGLVHFSLSYFLQHLLEQRFSLALQQSAAGDAAVAVPINAANVATKRRYFIKSSS